MLGLVFARVNATCSVTFHRCTIVAFAIVCTVHEDTHVIELILLMLLLLLLFAAVAAAAAAAAVVKRCQYTSIQVKTLGN